MTRTSMVSRLRARAQSFAKGRDGLAAIEFAYVMPFLALALMGSAEVARYVNAVRGLTNVANSMAEMLSQGGSGQVDYLLLTAAADSTMVLFPQVLSDSYSKGINWRSDITIKVSSYKFVLTVPSCTSNCAYTANLAFAFGDSQRLCTVHPTPVADDAVIANNTLPTDVFAPGSIIAVEIAYDYAPFYGIGVIPATTVRRAAYFHPRQVALITYDNTTSGDPLTTTKCPGY